MKTKELSEIILYDMTKIPHFINPKKEMDKYRFELLSEIIRMLELCIDENVIDYEEVAILDDQIFIHLGTILETCEFDSVMKFHIWAYITSSYHYYLDLAVENDLFESAANLHKIKCLNNEQ